MSRPSKKHHFVPQAQLRHFAADAEQRSIIVFDKKTDRSFRTSILNAGSENDFNTVGFANGKWNFEDLFQEVDTHSAKLVGEIISRRSLAWLTAEDRVALADFFATQLLRTHFSRMTPKHIAKRLRDIVRQIGYDPDEDPGMAMPSDAFLRLGAVKTFLARGDNVRSLMRLQPALYTTGGELRFVLSDHPVSIANAFPYGDEGLMSHGILVQLPISSDLLITLHCPTIVKRYELVIEENLESGRRERILSYRDGLRSGQPIQADDGTVLNLNLRQIAQSARYLYAATDLFDFARGFLEKHDDLRTVETHTKMGEIGRASPRRGGMPPGIHLVIQGVADHCMVAIEELDEVGEGLTARTRQVELIGQIARDKHVFRAELYVDGQIRRGLGQATLERIGNPSDGWFRIVHGDPSLRALSKTLDAQRG